MPRMTIDGTPVASGEVRYTCAMHGVELTVYAQVDGEDFLAKWRDRATVRVEVDDSQMGLRLSVAGVIVDLRTRHPWPRMDLEIRTSA